MATPPRKAAPRKAAAVTEIATARGRAPRAAARPAYAQPAGELDLDAVSVGAAARAYPFRLGGVSYRLLCLEDLPIEVAEAADTGDIGAVRQAIECGLVGNEDGAAYESFMSAKPGIRQLVMLFEGWLAHSQAKPGESAPSPQNFAPTAKR